MQFTCENFSPSYLLSPVCHYYCSTIMIACISINKSSDFDLPRNWEILGFRIGAVISVILGCGASSVADDAHLFMNLSILANMTTVWYRNIEHKWPTDAAPLPGRKRSKFGYVFGIPVTRARSLAKTCCSSNGEAAALYAFCSDSAHLTWPAFLLGEMPPLKLKII